MRKHASCQKLVQLVGACPKACTTITTTTTTNNNNNQQPTTNSQQPTANSQQPTTNNQQPTTTTTTSNNKQHEQEQEEEENKERRRRRRKQRTKKKKTRSAKRNTNHKQKPQRAIGQVATAATKRKRKQKPQSAKRQTPQEKRQYNHPMAQGKKTNTPGGQKPHSAKRQAPTTITESKKNTPACRSPWASKDKHQQQRPATKDQCQPQPPRGREAQQKGQDHQNCKTKGAPGGAEAPKRQKTNHSRGQTPTAAHKSLKAQNAKTARSKPRAIKCSAAANAALSLLHRRGRGDGGCSSGTNP